MNLVSRFPYATFANFSPRGTSELSQKSRNACYAFKRGDESYVDFLANNFVTNIPTYPFADFFGPNVTLVPMPRSSPVVTGGVWPAKIIADGLVAKGLAHEVDALVERAYAVPKSSTSAPGQRPTLNTHYQSFRVKNKLLMPPRITLIDDVLTKGCTAGAAAECLRLRYPNADIKIFAVMRTQSFIDITAVQDPSVGTITVNLDADSVSRIP